MLNSMDSHLSGNERDKEAISICRNTEEGRNGETERSTTVISGANMVVWLLSVVASHDDKIKIDIMEAGAVEVLTERISDCSSQDTQVLYLFQDFSLLAECKLYLCSIWRLRNPWILAQVLVASAFFFFSSRVRISKP